MITQTGQWKWRDGEISMKEFRKLSLEEKQEYLDLIKGLEQSERSTMDDYLVEIYNLDKKKPINLFEL